jgi:hypothetical protein
LQLLFAGFGRVAGAGFSVGNRWHVACRAMGVWARNRRFAHNWRLAGRRKASGLHTILHFAFFIQPFPLFPVSSFSL